MAIAKVDIFRRINEILEDSRVYYRIDSSGYLIHTENNVREGKIIVRILPDHSANLRFFDRITRQITGLTLTDVDLTSYADVATVLEFLHVNTRFTEVDFDDWEAARDAGDSYTIDGRDLTVHRELIYPETGGFAIEGFPRHIHRVEETHSGPDLANTSTVASFGEINNANWALGSHTIQDGWNFSSVEYIGEDPFVWSFLPFHMELDVTIHSLPDDGTSVPRFRVFVYDSSDNAVAGTALTANITETGDFTYTSNRVTYSNVPITTGSRILISTFEPEEADKPLEYTINALRVSFTNDDFVRS